MFTVDDVFMPKDETLNVSDHYYYCTHHIFVMPLIATVDIYIYFYSIYFTVWEGQYIIYYVYIIILLHTIQQRI